MKPKQKVADPRFGKPFACPHMRTVNKSIAIRSGFLELVDPDEVGYSSADSF